MTEVSSIVFVASTISLVLGFVTNGVMSHVFGGMPDMKKRLNTLETDRVAKLENTVKEMQDKCQLHQNSGKLDVLIERVDGLKSTIEATKKESQAQHAEVKQMVSRAEDIARAAATDAATAVTRASGHSKWIDHHETTKHGGK